MKDERLFEVEQSLLLHQVHLRKFLEAEDRMTSGVHNFVAVQLRALLCDSDFPILLRYLKMKELQLFVHAPCQPSEWELQHVVVSIIPCAISRRPFSHSEILHIDQYLDCRIQTVAKMRGKWEDGGDSVSPRQLIKWVANKDGFAHFDLKKPLTFQSIKSGKLVGDGFQIDDFFVKDKLFQIGAWVAEIIDVVIISPPKRSII